MYRLDRLATSNDSSDRHRRSSKRANEEVSEVSEVVQLSAGEWGHCGVVCAPRLLGKILLSGVKLFYTAQQPPSGASSEPSATGTLHVNFCKIVDCE